VLRELFEQHSFDTLLDVGANVGQSCRRFRENKFTGRIISFEPLPDACAKLRERMSADLQWSLCETCLGESDGTVELVVGGGDGQSSSVFDVRPDRYGVLAGRAPVKRISVGMRTLDSVCKELGFAPARTFLKLDVQGAELKVLAGATGILAEVPAIQTEMALVPTYVGQPVFGEVLQYLRDKGFYLHHLYNGWTTPSMGELLETDGLFLNSRIFGQARD
jgi:FkbM family methyltransferase